MDDEPYNQPEDALESDQLRPWLQSIADSEDIDEADVVERLVSSYWTLNEVLDVVGGTQDIPDFGGEGGIGESEADHPRGVVDEVAALRERLDRLEEDMPADGTSAVDAIENRLASVSSRLSTVEETLTSDVEDLQARLDAELVNLERILTHLVDRKEELETRLQSVENQWLGDGTGGRGRLRALKRTAHQLGVRTGTCDHCGATIDLTVLPSAACLRCDRRFTGIEERTRWFRRTEHLFITENSSGGDGQQVLSAATDLQAKEQEDMDHSTDDSRSDSFVWGDQPD